jgi:hypothetical protein
MRANRRKANYASIEDIGRKLDNEVKEENIDTDKTVAKAVEWARKSKESSNTSAEKDQFLSPKHFSIYIPQKKE